MPSHIQREFFERLERVPVHGLGLSVDVYSPDLSSLLGSLRLRQALPTYLEIFRAAPSALAAAREQAGELPLAYHGEGLWLTPPGAAEDPAFRRELRDVADQLRLLGSAWSNHECATKEIAGYSFGTYLPPLYTPSSAAIVASNARFAQAQMDRAVRLANGASPLLLLEMPPLTYFVAGTLSIPDFFRAVADQAPCGFVLDMGHLWTVYRYSGVWKMGTLMQFADEFLDGFPLERVVEIHVAGLAVHESSRADEAPPSGAGRGCPLPAWTDAHMAPIPSVLFDLLDRTLSHPRLTHVRGLALEVDTKPIDMIVEEFEVFRRRYGAVFPQAGPARLDNVSRELPDQAADEAPDPMVRDGARAAYARYARVVAGLAQPAGDEWTGPHADVDELDRYRTAYLPHEILRWGGEVPAMFPEVCRRLAERGIALSRFVPFWFREPRATSGSYDFFLIKIERFQEFVHEEAPDLDDLAVREAHELRQAYAAANEPAVFAIGEVR